LRVEIMVEALKSLAKKTLWALKIPYLPEAIRAVLKGPYTVKFPFGETFDTGTYRGATVWDEDVCIGCGACYEVCPSSAIEMVDDTESDPPMRRFRLDYGRCIFCGHCHYNCTTDDGIYQTQEWNLVTYDRTDSFTTVEKELVLCDCCGEVVAPKDHIRWVAGKVGPKAYANPGLALTLEGGLINAPQPVGAGGEGPGRPDIMKVLCPHCRRVVVFEEIA
jgi:hydrogenase-4 component H